MGHSKRRFTDPDNLKGAHVYADTEHVAPERTAGTFRRLAQNVGEAADTQNAGSESQGPGHSVWRFTTDSPPESAL